LATVLFVFFLLTTVLFVFFSIGHGIVSSNKTVANRKKDKQYSDQWKKDKQYSGQ
jgi:hypothetical protein